MSDPARTSLTGLQTLLLLCRGTRELAAERGFTNLVAQFDLAIRDAEEAPQLQAGELDRKYVFSRLSALQRDALICFRDDRDLGGPT